MPGRGDNRTIFEAASRPQRSLYRLASCHAALCDTSTSPQLPHFTSLHTTPATASVLRDRSHAMPLN